MVNNKYFVYIYCAVYNSNFNVTEERRDPFEPRTAFCDRVCNRECRGLEDPLYINCIRVSLFKIPIFIQKFVQIVLCRTIDLNKNKLYRFCSFPQNLKKFGTLFLSLRYEKNSWKVQTYLNSNLANNFEIS